jgi:hypothetical protein
MFYPFGHCNVNERFVITFCKKVRLLTTQKFFLNEY